MASNRSCSARRISLSAVMRATARLDGRAHAAPSSSSATGAAETSRRQLASDDFNRPRSVVHAEFRDRFRSAVITNLPDLVRDDVLERVQVAIALPVDEDRRVLIALVVDARPAARP